MSIHLFQQPMMVGAIVLAACIVGIYTRYLFSLASFWPANGLLLCVFILKPQINRPAAWLSAFAGYMAADLIAGSDLLLSALLNLVNLSGVAAGVLTRLVAPDDLLGMRRPIHAIYVILIMGASASGAALGGMLIGPAYFDLNWTQSFYFWFTAEFVNFAVVVPPVLLLAMRHAGPLSFLSRNVDIAWRQVAALALLAALVALMHISGGPGAVAFPIPALLWCAVRFRPYISALLGSLTAVWILIAAPLGWIPLYFDLTNSTEMASFRLGVAMVIIGPFAVACLNSAWRNAHQELQRLASYDTLTDVFNRGAFMTGAEGVLAMDKPACLLMIDIDKFKLINDVHGHAAGDQAIRALAQVLTSTTRSTDLVGRVGGEEFCVLLAGATKAQGRSIAESMRCAVEQLEMATDAGARYGMSISVGVADRSVADSLTEIMSAADAGLYAAKRSGRNRVVAI